MRHPGLRQFAVFPVFSILPSVTRVALVIARGAARSLPPLERGVGASSLSGRVGEPRRSVPAPRVARTHRAESSGRPQLQVPLDGALRVGAGFPRAVAATSARVAACPGMRARTRQNPG